MIAYIRADNPMAAENFAVSLIDQIELLTYFPEMGRVLPERNDPALREIVFRRYRIIYRLSNAKTELEIVRLWHAARDYPSFPEIS